MIYIHFVWKNRLLEICYSRNGFQSPVLQICGPEGVAWNRAYGHIYHSHTVISNLTNSLHYAAQFKLRFIFKITKWSKYWWQWTPIECHLLFKAHSECRWNSSEKCSSACLHFKEVPFAKGNNDINERLSSPSIRSSKSMYRRAFDSKIPVDPLMSTTVQDNSNPKSNFTTNSISCL